MTAAGVNAPAPVQISPAELLPAPNPVPVAAQT
jgi:hypothetical protein